MPRLHESLTSTNEADLFFHPTQFVHILSEI